MDLTEKKLLLSTIVDGKNSDETLTAYLDLAEKKIVNRVYECFTDRTGLEMPPQYDGLQVEIAAYMLNKRGAEGELSHSENGVSRAYETGDLPDSILREIVPKCGVTAS